MDRSARLEDGAARTTTRSHRVAAALGLAIAVALWAFDLHLDVHDRDVFSWMDPYQYYDFGRDVLAGRRSFREFEVPSIFPLMLLPILSVDDSIPAALWIGFVATLALLGATYALARVLRLSTPPLVVAALVVSSPLYMGLSRSLYVECTLTAIVAWGLALWLRVLRRPDGRNVALFGAVMFLGTLTKTTFPIFLLPPVVVAATERWIARRPRDALRLLGAGLLPLLGAVGVEMAVFSRSFGYVLSAGNTALPIAYLIGPHVALSWAGTTYYLAEIARRGLLLLSPMLLLGVVVAWRRRRALRWTDLGSPRAMLWVALIAPALLLVVPSVKEPRHVLPVIVPAALLIVLGIEESGGRRVRRALITVALGLAALQYAAVAAHWIDAPYFLDRPLRVGDLEAVLRGASRPGRHAQSPPGLRALHWKYDQSIAIAGFEPSEALALVWWAFPGIVYDLDVERDRAPASRVPPPDRFEDLFVLAAFNVYNRRSGWLHAYETLDVDRIVTDADFVILGPAAPESPSVRFPAHRLLATIARRGGDLRVLGRAGAAAPHYRTSYAEAFLRTHPDLPDAEERVVARSLLLTAVLGGEWERVEAIIRRHPVLRRAGGSDRNIYWIGGYASLAEWADQRLRAWGSRPGAIDPAGPH